MKHNPNRPRRREPYHYDAEGALYIASIYPFCSTGKAFL